MSPGRTQCNARGDGQFRVMRAGDLSLENIGGLTFFGVLDQESLVLVFPVVFNFCRKLRMLQSAPGSI
jgi:hypothetical protein